MLPSALVVGLTAQESRPYFMNESLEIRQERAQEVYQFRFKVECTPTDENLRELSELLRGLFPISGDAAYERHAADISSQVRLAQKCLENALKFKTFERRQKEVNLAETCISRLSVFYQEMGRSRLT